MNGSRYDSFDMQEGGMVGYAIISLTLISRRISLTLPSTDRSSDLLAACTPLLVAAILLPSSNQLFHIDAALPSPLPLSLLLSPTVHAVATVVAAAQPLLQPSSAVVAALCLWKLSAFVVALSVAYSPRSHTIICRSRRLCCLLPTLFPIEFVAIVATPALSQIQLLVLE
ncbi:hypothetical protein BHM03_00027968 [Ensete ventricosum]|nr:hypothetical protein BHM03_00027968 [Ensete ventricosum]